MLLAEKWDAQEKSLSTESACCGLACKLCAGECSDACQRLKACLYLPARKVLAHLAISSNEVKLGCMLLSFCLSRQVAANNHHQPFQVCVAHLPCVRICFLIERSPKWFCVRIDHRGRVEWYSHVNHAQYAPYSYEIHPGVGFREAQVLIHLAAP